MKMQKIICLISILALVSPLEIARSHVGAAHLHPHPHPHPHVVVHESPHPAHKTLANTNKEKSHAAVKTAKPTTAERIKGSSTVTTVKPFKPSPAVLKKSVNNLFTQQNKKSLTSFEVISLSKSTDYKGQEAAMLAALVMQVNDVKDPKDLKFTQEELLKKFADKKSNLYIAYTNTLSKINEVRSLSENQKLYGPNGLSSKTHIIQGSENDCYFLSAVNSLLKTPGGPQALQAMITPVAGKPNQFTVKFPGDPTPESVKLTETEIGMYSKVEKGGQWLAVLSVAEAMRRDRLRLNPEVTMTPGYQTQTLSLLTGQKYVQKSLPAQLTTQDSQQLEHTIKTALDNSMPIGIQTNEHDLSIIGYTNGNVIIKNPWGTNGWYNPKTAGWSTASGQPTTPGPWYLMKGGVFSVPLSQISDGFVDIAYHPEKEIAPVTPVSPVEPSSTSS